MIRRRHVFAPAAALFAAAARAANPGEALRKAMLEAVESKQIPGAVVVVREKGRNVVEEAAGWAVIEEKRPMRVGDIFMIASSTKPFSATTIMTLVDRGELRLDDPVRKFYPEFAGSSDIRQLLSHTSGLFGNDAPREVVEPIRNFDRPLRDAVSLIVKAPLAYEPGTKFSYGGASFCVAAGIAEKITGQDFEQYMRKVLLEPLGMRETQFRSAVDLSPRVPQIYKRRKGGGFEPVPAVMELPGRRGPRPDGFVLAAGGLYATAGDAVRFLEMHLNDGESNGKRILSQESVRAMQARQTGAAGEEYGLGWRRMEFDASGQVVVFGHGGAYGTQLIVDKRRGLVAAIFTQMPSGESAKFLSAARAAVAREA
ncbi:MAG: serine hydrolase domain-containing protein [Bryobacteraceae bacterium]